MTIMKVNHQKVITQTTKSKLACTKSLENYMHKEPIQEGYVGEYVFQIWPSPQYLGSKVL